MDKSRQGGTASDSAVVSMTSSQKDKPPAHLYHPGVASLPEEPKTPEAASVAGKRRRSSDGKKSGAKKRRKSQGEVENPTGETTAPGSKSVESSPASKMSPCSIRGKRGSFEGFEQEDIHILAHETRSVRGKKLSPEASTTASVFSTASPTVSTALSVTSPASTAVASGSPALDSPTHSRSRRAQSEATPTSTLPQATSSSPSCRGQQSSETGSGSPRILSSPTRSRRNVPQDPTIDLGTSVSVDQHAISCCGTNLAALTTDSVEAGSRRRIGSGIHLDTSVESLPSVASLHSPTSESFHSADDDPTSPRKERRHRDGSKKKKKDKDKELEGGRKKKKHHHRDKHCLGEMASEMVTPVRIKVCSFKSFLSLYLPSYIVTYIMRSQKCALYFFYF